MGVFKSVANAIDASTSSLSSVGGLMITSVSTVIASCMAIMLLWHAIKVGDGTAKLNVTETIAPLIRPFFVSVFLVTGYQVNVVGIINALLSDMTTMFGSGSNDPFIALDLLLNNAINMWDTFTAKHGITDILTNGLLLADIAILFFLILGILIFCIIATAALILMSFSLKFIFAVGVIYMGFLAFNVTTNFATGWISTAMKYVMTFAVLSFVIGLANVIVTQVLAGAMQSDTTSMLGKMAGSLGAAGVLVLFVFLSFQLAADVTGGMAIQAGGAAARAFSKVANTAGNVAGGSAKALGSGASAAGNMAAYSLGKTAAQTDSGGNLVNPKTAQIANLAERISAAKQVAQGNAGNDWTRGSFGRSIATGRSNASNNISAGSQGSGNNSASTVNQGAYAASMTNFMNQSQSK